MSLLYEDAVHDFHLTLSFCSSSLLSFHFPPHTFARQKDFVASEFHHEAPALLPLPLLPPNTHTNTHVRTQIYMQTHVHHQNLASGATIILQRKPSKREFHYVQRPKKRSRWKISQEEPVGISHSRRAHVTHDTSRTTTGIYCLDRSCV